jgi:hypothetical protein
VIRLHFVVEGQTEEEFVNALLVNHLVEYNAICDARCVLTSRQGHRQFKGGVSRYLQIQRDLRLRMKEDSNADARFTTMFDLYRLPADFPGMDDVEGGPDAYRKVALVESRFSEDIADTRFVPHIQLHEFEALLFSDISYLQIEFPAALKEVARLQDLAARFGSPELIDDGPGAAPSKRIIAEIPAYAGLKVSAGPRVAAAIGLPLIREKCAHFNAWLRRLEQLAAV